MASSNSGQGQTEGYISLTDSSATMMRAVAAALSDEWMVPELWPAYVQALSGAANRLPEVARLRLVERFVRNAGVSPEQAGQITSAGLAQWAVDLYCGEVDGRMGGAPQPPPGNGQGSGSSGGAPYNAMVIGAPSGGIAHLAALLDAPFLSQHFVTRFRYQGQADDVSGYCGFGRRLAETVLEHNPDLAVINHYDPIHNRFLVPHVNHLRMKLLDLPVPYADFIRARLRGGGTLLFSDCQFMWGQYRVEKRHTFQVGGLGGIPDDEWIKGSAHVKAFLAERGRSDQGDWSIASPWLPAPESEWGSLPPFRQAVEDFAAANGYRFRVLRGSHPEDFSRLAFYAAYQAALSSGREPAGVLIDCFTQTSPTAALRAGLLPLWLPYNCSDSLAFLRQMAPQFPRGKPVLLAPAPSFSPAWDTVSARDWQAACPPDSEVTWIGVNPAALPVDLAGMFRFVPDLQAWCASHPQPDKPSFSITELELLVSSMAAAAATPQPG